MSNRIKVKKTHKLTVVAPGQSYVRTVALLTSRDLSKFTQQSTLKQQSKSESGSNSSFKQIPQQNSTQSSKKQRLLNLIC